MTVIGDVVDGNERATTYCEPLEAWQCGGGPRKEQSSICNVAPLRTWAETERLE